MTCGPAAWLQFVPTPYVADTLAGVMGYVAGGIGVPSIAIAVLFYYVRPAGQI